jgi:hypothetical protein
VLIGAPVEFYSDIQTGLRARHPDLAIAAMNICNGYLGYLPPRAAYALDVESGAERVLDAASAMAGARMAG